MKNGKKKVTGKKIKKSASELLDVMLKTALINGDESDENENDENENDENEYVTVEKFEEFGKNMTNLLKKMNDTIGGLSKKLEGTEEESEGTEEESDVSGDEIKKKDKKVEKKNTETGEESDASGDGDGDGKFVKQFIDIFNKIAQPTRKTYVVNKDGDLMKELGDDGTEIDINTISDEDFNKLSEATQKSIMNKEFRKRMLK